MATYGYSTPYTGRGDTGPLPPGYMEAATAPGRNLAMGIAAMGQGLGKAIEQYRTKKAETEAADQSRETLVGLYQQQLASDPKYLAIQQYTETGQLPQGVTEQDIPRYTQQVQADREMLNKFSNVLGEKFVDMSLAKKKAALGDAVMVLNQYRTDQQNQLRDQATRQQLQLGALQLEDILDKRKQQNVLMEGIKYFSGQPQTETVTEQTQVPISVQYQPEGPFAVPAQSAPAIRPEQFYSEQIPAFRPMQQPQFMRPQGLPSTQPTPSIPQTWESVLGAEFANRLGTPVQPERTTPTTVENQALTTFETTKQVPITTEQKIPYEQQSRKLTDFLIQQGAKPETIAMVPQIMSMISGQQKPIQVDTQTLPGGITVVRADGKVDILPAPKMVEGKDLTEGQAASLGFASRLSLNEKTLNEVASRGYKPGGLFEFGFTPERLRSEDRKIYEAAKRNWIAAKLRKESGAAIGKDEYSDADLQYFPQPGDTEKVLKQKANLRNTVYQSERTAIGRFADDYLNQISSGGQARSPLLSDPRVAAIRARQASGAITKQQAIQQIESLK
jgi:hypothetical protein